MRKVLIFLLLTFTCIASAQKKNAGNDELKPGTIISGVVYDGSDMSPLKGAIVVEMDFNDSLYNMVQADENGRFSFPLSGTGHILKVNYIPFKDAEVLLDKPVLEIVMERYNFGDDEIVYKKTTQSGTSIHRDIRNTIYNRQGE